VRSTLPTDVKEPVLRTIDPTDMPVAVVGISADLNDAEMYDLADDVVRPKIEQLPNVGLLIFMEGEKGKFMLSWIGKKLKKYEMSASLVSAKNWC